MDLQEYEHNNFEYRGIIVKHPVFIEASNMLEKLSKEPEYFPDFITFFLENKNFFFYSLYKESKDRIDQISSINKNMNQKVEEWNLKHCIKDIVNKNEDDTSKEEILFMNELYSEYFQVIDKLLQYFILYPEKYQEYGGKDMPPVFIFTQNLPNKQKYFEQFEKKHIEVLLHHSNNKYYSSFVTSFLLTDIVAIDGSIEPISNYLIHLFKKNLAINELIEPVKKDLRLSNEKHHDLFEKYLQIRYKTWPDMNDIYLTYRKIKLENVINNLIPIKEIIEPKLKI